MTKTNPDHLATSKNSNTNNTNIHTTGSPQTTTLNKKSPNNSPFSSVTSETLDYRFIPNNDDTDEDNDIRRNLSDAFDQKNTEKKPSLREQKKKEIIDKFLNPIDTALKDLKEWKDEKQLEQKSKRENAIVRLEKLRTKLADGLDKLIEKNHSKDLTAITTINQEVLPESKIIQSPHFNQNAINSRTESNINATLENSPHAKCARETGKVVTNLLNKSIKIDDKKKAAEDYQAKCAEKTWRPWKIAALGFLGALVGFVVGVVVGAVVGALAGAGAGAIPGAIVGGLKGIATGASIGVATGVGGGVGATIVGGLTTWGLYKVNRTEKKAADALVEYADTFSGNKSNQVAPTPP